MSSGSKSSEKKVEIADNNTFPITFDAIGNLA